MDTARIENLVDRYLDGVITDAEQSELEAILLSSDRARDMYWKLTGFHALLRRHEEEAWGGRRIPSNDTARASRLPQTTTASHKRRWNNKQLLRSVRTLGVVAVVLCAIAPVVLFMRFQREATVPGGQSPERLAQRVTTRSLEAADVPDEGMTDVVAVLAQTVEARWNPKFVTPMVGEPLAPGRLLLESGVAMIEFNCGATVLLEAPVDFEIVSRNHAYCYLGRVSARVPPPAIGFRIDTPAFEIVDRGTSFGVVVDESGRSEVHVLKGLVELKGERIVGSKEVGEGHAIVSQNDELSAETADSTSFLTQSDFVSRAISAQSERMAGWRDLSQSLRVDDSLVVWYTFEPSSPQVRTLKNHAPGATSDSNGIIIGCQWTDGRWPGKGALDFKRSTDRVRMQIPDEFESLTLMAWVRVDSLPNAYNSLLASDGFDPGDVLWEISRAGRIMIYVAQESFSTIHDDLRVQVNSGASRVVEPVQFSQWLHLGMVFDAESNTVSHWCNGELQGTTPFSTESPFHIGTAELGNWQPRPAALYPIRNFNGRMDEFLLFKRALSAKEIHRHYAMGQPSSDSFAQFEIDESE